jgi:hypothetical protein
MHALVSYTPLETHDATAPDFWVPVLLAIGVVIIGSSLGSIISHLVNRRRSRLGVVGTEASFDAGSLIIILPIIGLMILSGIAGREAIERSTTPDAKIIAYQENTADWVAQEYGIAVYSGPEGQLLVQEGRHGQVRITGVQDDKNVRAMLDKETGELVKVEPWLTTERTPAKG